MLAHAWGFSSNDGHKQTRTRYTKQKQIQRAERVDTSVFACLDQETRKAIQGDFFFSTQNHYHTLLKKKSCFQKAHNEM